MSPTQLLSNAAGPATVNPASSVTVLSLSACRALPSAMMFDRSTAVTERTAAGFSN